MNVNKSIALAAIKRAEELLTEIRAVKADSKIEASVRDARVKSLMADLTFAEDEATSAIEDSEREGQVRDLTSGVEARFGGTGKSGAYRAGQWLSDELRAISGASGAGAAWTPGENSALWFDRLTLNSALLSSGVNVYRTDSDQVTFPRLLTDAASAATTEGASITLTDSTGDSLIAIPRKYAVITKLSAEVANDSHPAILDMLAQSLLRSIALKMDGDFFAGSGTPPAIRGLSNVSGITNISAGANGLALTNLDLIAQAIGSVSEAGADAGAIVMPGRTWKGLLRLVEITGSNKPLLSQSAGSPSGGVERRILGVPVYLAPLSLTETQGSSSAASSIYVYSPEQLTVVVRSDARVTRDDSAYFGTDEIGLKVTARADLVVPNPLAVVRIAGVL